MAPFKMVAQMLPWGLRTFKKSLLKVVWVKGEKNTKVSMKLKYYLYKLTVYFTFPIFNVFFFNGFSMINITDHLQTCSILIKAHCHVI